MSKVLCTLFATIVIVSLDNIVFAQEFSVPFTVGTPKSVGSAPASNCGASNTPCGVPPDAGGAPASAGGFATDSVGTPASAGGAPPSSSSNCGASNTPCGVPVGAGGAPDSKSVTPPSREAN
jgi:hypothetical protein